MSVSEKHFGIATTYHRTNLPNKKNQRAVWAVVLAAAFLFAYIVLLAGAIHALDSKEGFYSVLRK